MYTHSCRTLNICRRSLCIFVALLVQQLLLQLKAFPFSITIYHLSFSLNVFFVQHIFDAIESLSIALSPFQPLSAFHPHSSPTRYLTLPFNASESTFIIFYCPLTPSCRSLAPLRHHLNPFRRPLIPPCRHLTPFCHP